MNARITTATLNARVTGLEAKLDRLIGLLEPKAPAKAQVRTAVRVKTAAGTKRKPTLLRKENRLAFVASAKAEGHDLTGFSTKAVVAYCASEGFLPKGWDISARYMEVCGF